MIINGTDIRMIRGDTEVLTVSCEQEDGSPRPFEDGDTVYFTVGRILQKSVTAFTEEGAAVIYIGHEDIPLRRAADGEGRDGDDHHTAQQICVGGGCDP